MDGSVQSATQHWVRALPSVVLQVSQPPQVLACQLLLRRGLSLPDSERPVLYSKVQTGSSMLCVDPATVGVTSANKMALD